MDFSSLNSTSRMENDMQMKKMSELEIGQKYDISKLRLVKTKFGSRIIATIADEFIVFLPARVGKALENDSNQLDQLNNEADQKRLQILYLGGPYNKFEFCGKI